MRIAPLMGPEGKTRGYLAVKRDVTEQRAGDEARRFLATIVEGSEDAIVSYSPSGTILTWNRGAETIFGYSSGEVVGKHVTFLVAPEKLRVFGLTLERLMRGESVPLRKGVALRKDGGRVHISIRSTPIRDSSGQVIAISDIVRDESMRQEVENTRAMLATIVDSSADAISSVDLDGVVLSWNSACELVHGYSREEAIGRNLEDLLPLSQQKKVRGILETVRRGGTVTPFETLLERKDGSLIYALARISVMRNAAGEVVGSSASLTDITDRIEKERAVEAAERKYRGIFDGAIEGIFQVAPDGKPLAVNPAMARMLGYASPKEFLELVEDVIKSVWVDLELRARILQQLNLTGSVMGVECPLKRKDGSHLWVSFSGRKVLGSGGKSAYVEGFIKDITERKREQEALEASEVRYRTVYQTSLDGIAITRMSDGRYIDVNKAFLDLMGYEQEEVLGKTTLGLNTWVDPDERKKWVEVLRTDSVYRDVTVQLRKKNGDAFWSLNSSAVIQIDGAECIMTVVRDISKARADAEEIRNLAFYDPLTGVPNRRLVSEHLQDALARAARNHRKGGLLLVDVDHLKQINDSLGHKAGDVLLQEVARRLKACVRESDTVGRFAGDEFVVLLQDLSENAEEAEAQIQAIGEKILKAVHTSFLIEGHEIEEGCSIGMTLFDSHDGGADEILQQADIAIYQAKAAGGDTVQFFAPALQAAVNARVAMKDDLRQAIRSNQFELYYQPQFDHEELIGAEALIRWNHPGRGLVPPDEFIPVAEETGLILQIGNWVLETACEQIAVLAQREETAGVTVAVNISAREFRQPDFVERVLSAVFRSNANARKLKLELTESMLVDNLGDIIGKMTELKAFGVSFSLDDFGTGYSSLSYLKRLPLDQLKIDRSFVRDMLDNDTSGAIAQTIISLSKALGLSVIAEGVETEEQREYLARYGCYSYQGYLFGRPLPFEEFLEQCKACPGNRSRRLSAFRSGRR
ncbi:MAG: PAS domain S-box protein [Terracidiphilus sp.]